MKPDRTLYTLLEALRREGLLLPGDPVPDRTFDHLAFDSRVVGPSGCFVAFRGVTTDGHRFIDKAVQNGATAIVCEAAPEGPVPPGVARIRVTDSRRALSVLASAWHGRPAMAMDVVGVTGTNGKTTTAWIISQALDRAGHPAGFIGTTGVGRPGAIEPSSHTTPDPLSLHAAFADLLTTGCTHVAMEVSSHALAQDRVHGVSFRAAVFTNLTRDHLDYHADFDDYLEAKRRLFRSLAPDSVAVLHADDPAHERMAAGCAAPVMTFGTGDRADVRYEILSDGMDGLELRLDGARQRFELAGRFNAANLAAAYSALRALGVSAGEALSALSHARPAPGRFEVIRRPDDRFAIVDYAHTPDALENVLRAARPLVTGSARLWCVFGCGGDRDRGKRPIMGRIAETLADAVVVTSDNPRTEDPEAILFDIRAGMARPDSAAWLVDRREAIRSALGAAGPGDVVLVAGKGHEPYQVVGTEHLPFDDRREIMDAPLAH